MADWWRERRGAREEPGQPGTAGPGAAQLPHPAGEAGKRRRHAGLADNSRCSSDRPLWRGVRSAGRCARLAAVAWRHGEAAQRALLHGSRLSGRATTRDELEGCAGSGGGGFGLASREEEEDLVRRDRLVGTLERRAVVATASSRLRSWRASSWCGTVRRGGRERQRARQCVCLVELECEREPGGGSSGVAFGLG